jgi:hypothetical protein
MAEPRLELVEELKIAACVLPEESTHRDLLLRAAERLREWQDASALLQQLWAKSPAPDWSIAPAVRELNVIRSASKRWSEYDALQSLRCARCGHEYRPGVTVRERGQFVCPGPVEKPCGARYVWDKGWRAEGQGSDGR